MNKNSQNSLRSFHQADTRILILVTIAVVILIIYLVTASFYASLNHSKQEVLNRLRAIAFTSAYLIDGDKHEKLSLTYSSKDDIVTSQSNEVYFEMHQTLQMVQQANQLETSIYTIVFHPPDSTFRFIVTSSAFPYYRHVYKSYPQELLTKTKIGGVLDVYQDENGVWLSAFAPIRNSKGQVVALIEADENFEGFIANARRELLMNFLVALVLIVPFIYALLRFLAHTLRKREQAHELLQEKNEEIQTQNEVILKNQLQLEKANHKIKVQNELLEMRVKERTLDLEKSNEELSQFLYHSSHDVQAPVATLKGLVLLLGNDPKESQNIVMHMSKTLDRLDRMLKTLQAFHRSKTKLLEENEVDIPSLIDVIEQKLGADRSDQLKIEHEYLRTSIRSDIELVEIILTELLRNSFQFSSLVSNPIVKISSTSRDNDFILEVEDNGPGILPDLRRNLFGMFMRGNERSTGMGMGLKIAKIGVERLGGSIHYMEVPRGCKFLIRLPAT